MFSCQCTPTFMGAHRMPIPRLGLLGRSCRAGPSQSQLKLDEGHDHWEWTLKKKFRGKLMRKAETLGDSLLEFGAGTDGGWWARSLQMVRCFQTGTKGLETKCWAPPTLPTDRTGRLMEMPPSHSTDGETGSWLFGSLFTQPRPQKC